MSFSLPIHTNATFNENETVEGGYEIKKVGDEWIATRYGTVIARSGFRFDVVRKVSRHRSLISNNRMGRGRV